MLVKCQEWRRTVEGVGLDAIYDEIDPFDVGINYGTARGDSEGF